MTNATAAAANLKDSDGVLKPGGFPAYARKHGAAPLRHVMRATDRRRDAACELGGYDKASYNARAEAFVESLLARAPRDVAAMPFARALAFAYASHRAVADARKALAAKAAEAPAADVERAAIVAEVAEAAEAPAVEAPAAYIARVEAEWSAVRTELALAVAALDVAALDVAVAPHAPANDVAPLPPTPGGVPSAGAVWALLRADGIRRCREVGGAWRVVYVTRLDERFGLTAVVTHPGDFDAVRRVLESFGLPLAERDVPSGGRHFELFAAAPFTSEPMTPAVRWPGRDDYMPAVEAAQ